jgi:hypothetical protein
VLRDSTTGEEENVPAAGLFVMIGAEPHTDWLPPGVRARQVGLHPHRKRRRRFRVFSRPPPVARDRFARGVCGGRRKARFDEASRLRRGRGVDCDSLRPRAPRDEGLGELRTSSDP